MKGSQGPWAWSGSDHGLERAYSGRWQLTRGHGWEERGLGSPFSWAGNCSGVLERGLSAEGSCVGREGWGSPRAGTCCRRARDPPSRTSPVCPSPTGPLPILCCTAFLPLPDKFPLQNLTSFQTFCWANYIKMDVAGTLYGLFIVILFLSHAYK